MDKKSIKKKVLKKVERIDQVYSRPSPEEIIDMVFEEIELNKKDQMVPLEKNHHFPGIALEEGNLSQDVKSSNFPRTITLSVSGTHMSYNECPECGKYMEFYLNMDLGNRIDLTSSYTLHYSCESGHKFKMTLDEAIEKYETKL